MLTCGTLVDPFLAAKLVQVTTAIHLAMGLKFLSNALDVMQWFFVVGMAVLAAHGAALVAIFIAARFGLIENPWN